LTADYITGYSPRVMGGVYARNVQWTPNPQTGLITTARGDGVTVLAGTLRVGFNDRYAIKLYQLRSVPPALRESKSMASSVRMMPADDMNC
jgi:hypothetical protein